MYLKKVKESLIFTDTVFKNICSVEDMPPELTKHFNDTFDIKEFKKIAGKINIKIKAGTEKLLMSQLCQIYCALVIVILKSKMAEKGSKNKKKNKSKTKNKKGGVLLQDENDKYLRLEDRERGMVGKMMDYVKRNWIQISIILFNIYIIYLAYTDLREILDTGITFELQQIESSGLVVYNEGDNLVATLNADMVQMERVSVLDLVLNYAEVAPKLQTALMQEFNYRIAEYTGDIRKESIERVRGLEVDLYNAIQNEAGIDDKDNVNRLKFLYAAMNPSSLITKAVDKTLKLGRRHIRDFWTNLDRDLEDLRTGLMDYTEDGIDVTFNSITRDSYLLYYSGLTLLGMTAKLIYSNYMKRTYIQDGYEELENRNRTPLYLSNTRGRKKLKSKKGKKTKKKGSKKMRR